MNSPKKVFKVNSQQFFTDKDSLTANEIRDLVSVDASYEVWKIIGIPDQEGQLPVDDVLVTDSIDIKSGDQFRTVPPGTFGAR